MTRSDFLRPESSSADTSLVIGQATFSQLYDRYASALLGVINAIICDEDEAVRLLTLTFARIHLQFSQPRPDSQPLFIWLLAIARTTAIEAKKSERKPDVPVFKITQYGQVVADMSAGGHSASSLKRTRTLVASPTNELLEAILFRNCTPEEAASSIGLPAATARQQLRTAMLQLRAQRS